jgi:HEAT repeat protein
MHKEKKTPNPAFSRGLSRTSIMTSSRFIPLACFFVLASSLQAQQDDPKSKKGPPPVEGLKALQHPDASVRYGAVETLIQLGPLGKFAVPELRELLKDKSPLVRVKAAEALWKIDKTPSPTLMPILLAAMKEKSGRVRAAAPPVIALFGSKAKPALPALVQALKDKEFDVKLAAVTALGDLGPVAKNTASDLLDLTKDKEFFLLEPFVGAALANLGESVVPTLSQALADSSADRRRVAAYALGSMGANAVAAAPALATALKHEDPATRKMAARGLGKIGPAAKKFLPQLDSALNDKDPYVRIDAALATWYISGEAKKVTVLVELLRHESVDVRDATCQALATMKKDAEAAVPPLLKLLSRDKDLRIRIVLTLGEIGPAAKAAVPDLTTLLKDKDVETRLSTAFVLWQITGETKDALPVLEKGLALEGHDKLAIRLLGEMEKAALTVLPTLVALYREEEEFTYRQLLAAAIKKIDPKAAMKLGIR